MEIICYACGKGENPENTLEGIKHCQSVNSSWRVEMDIQLTKDHQLVLFHDQTTTRLTGKEHWIHDLELSEAQALDVGFSFQQQKHKPYSMPTLKTVLETFPEMKIMLDIHTNKPIVIDKVIELIEAYAATERVVIASQYDLIINLFKQKRPNWIYGAAAKEAKRLIYSSFVFLDTWFPLSSNILMIPEYYGNIKVLTPRVRKHVKKQQKKIWAWCLESKQKVLTIEHKKQLETFKKLGVDGIFTAYPQQLMKEINS